MKELNAALFSFSLLRASSYAPFIIFVNRVRFVVVRGAILSRFDARFEEESCGFFRLREFIQRERRWGKVHCGWSGTLWLKGGRMFAEGRS